MRNFKSLLILLLGPFWLPACVTVVIETSSLDTANLGLVEADAVGLARAVGPANVLVVFDLDNTLLAMEQGLGSDQWYEWQKKRGAEDECDQKLVADRLAVQGAMYFASAMRPTQPDAPELVRRLQDEGFPVIALTSRGVDYRLQTFRELRRNGYDFRRTAIGPAGGWPDAFIPDNGIRPARYEDGVFLTTGQHKGEMLLELLRRTGTPLPRVVVMADDKSSNLEAVRESMTRVGVPVRAWRFAGEDVRVAAFDPETSHAMWQELEPALRAIQDVLGPDNYRLPAPAKRTGCD
jgi:phosphoglycolate phosphatase-like HAD superfamily hydrolase